MTKTIRILTLLALMVIGAGQAWASINGKPNLGKIVYTKSANDHGSLTFFKEEACTNPINTTTYGVYSFGLTSVTVKDESGETVIGYKVYIKATPDFGYTLEAADNEGKVSFIKAEVTVAGTDVAGARTRRGAGPTVNVGDFIDVTATDTRGIYCITMPADKNLNLHITATFPKNEPISVSYYDPTAEGDNKTKTVFATPLTGNETTLAPGWYVVNKDVDYTTVHTGESLPSVLSATGNVNLILANGKTMNIGSAKSPVDANGIRFSTAATLAIYGQGGTTEGSLNIYTNNRYPIENTSGITIYGGNLTVNHNLLTEGTFTIHGGTFTDARTTNDNNATTITAINAAEINIRGGKVESEVSELYTNDKGTGNINISGGVVNVLCLYTAKGSIAISGGQVTLTITKNSAIYSKNDITLGWTNATDFISVEPNVKYSSTSADGILTINEGKPFLAISGDNPRDYYDSKSTFTRDNHNFTALTGKTLKPALKITLPEGVTAAGTDVVTDEIAGTYAIYGAEVTLSGTASAGNTLSFTVKDASNNDVTVESNGFTMPATDVTVTATQTAIPATAPTISTQPSGLDNLVWSYTSDNVLSISASAAEGHTLSYQWYSNSTSSNTDGTAIDGATSASYAVSTENTGTFYYYCVVTATRSDNNETASVSSEVATVKVNPKSYDYSTSTISCAITQDENGYSVHLTEGEGSANQLPVSGTMADLDYSRTLTAPTESNKDVTIGNESANLYTVCLPFTPDTGTGVTYYTLSKVEGTTLSFEEISGSPAAFTPYLVAVTGNNNFTEDCSNVNFKTTATIHSTTVDGYTFTGTLTGLKNADAQGKYILQADNKWGKVTSENGDARIPPFRAYIEGPANGARLLYSSFDGDATGIQNIRTVDADGTEQWYDLNGRRIVKPTTKGVYIRNGKKTTN